MAGSADITGRQNYVQAIGHPKSNAFEAAPGMSGYVSAATAAGAGTALTMKVGRLSVEIVS